MARWQHKDVVNAYKDFLLVTLLYAEFCAREASLLLMSKGNAVDPTLVHILTYCLSCLLIYGVRFKNSSGGRCLALLLIFCPVRCTEVKQGEESSLEPGRPQ